MTNETFQRVVETTIDEVRTTLQMKGEEYGPKGDRLKAFKDLATFKESSPLSELLSLQGKHLIAYKDFILTLNSNGGEVPLKWFNEKTLDIITYTILARALFYERMADALDRPTISMGDK